MKNMNINFPGFKITNDNIKNLYFGFKNPYLQSLGYLLLFLFVSKTSGAQQVTKMDCCSDLGGKATIIINNSTSPAPHASPNAAPVNTTTVNGGFDFKLEVAANTSAGVYNSSDVLIRTLWSGVRYDAGCYHGQWDGFMDDGVTVAPLGSYTVKVLSNNVQYTWEGVIGNTSTDLSGDYIIKGEDIGDMCFVGNKCFYPTGYSEHASSQKMVLTSDPN